MKTVEINNIDVCLAYEKFNEDPYGNLFPFEMLAHKFKVEEKKAYAACVRAFEDGYIECDKSLKTGSLSLDGKDLLRRYRLSKKNGKSKSKSH